MPKVIRAHRDIKRFAVIETVGFASDQRIAATVVEETRGDHSFPKKYWGFVAQPRRAARSRINGQPKFQDDKWSQRP